MNFSHEVKFLLNLKKDVILLESKNFNNIFKFTIIKIFVNYFISNDAYYYYANALVL